MEMHDVMELVEIAQDTLDDVWKCTDFEAYPEPRMKHLMDIIGKTVDFTECFYTPRERSSWGYIEITLSVRLSVRLSVCPSVCLCRFVSGP